MSTQVQPFGVIGGGIVGLAVARELTKRHPGAGVQVFEKEAAIATHQTGRNSGVVHAGIYYKPGSLKAQLCGRGRALLQEYCAEHGLPYEECGKLVVAVDDSERGRFDALEQTATANGVPGLRRVQGAAIAEIEPHAAGLLALHSPRTAITDFVAIARSFADELAAEGGSVHTSMGVSRIERVGKAVAVTTETGDVHRFAKVVVCSGLQADRMGREVDGHEEPRIVPFRGEYMTVSAAKRDLVRGMIYPVPDPRYPFLGVHFTRRVTGDLEVGPNAVLALDREGSRRSAVRPADVAAIVGWPGFWRMAQAHWRTGAREVWGTLSKRSYMRMASRYVPAIGPEDVVRSRFGVRAQAVDRDGSLVDDFRLYASDGVISLRNAPSPAATSSMAIADHVADLVARS